MTGVCTRAPKTNVLINSLIKWPLYLPVTVTIYVSVEASTYSVEASTYSV